MLTPKFDSLSSIVTDELNEIRAYFNCLSKSSTTPEILVQRVVGELPTKLNELCFTLGKTAIAYLESDGRSAISEWQSHTKNLFYETALPEKIAHTISASDFSAQGYTTLRNSALATTLCASGGALFFIPSPVDLSIPAVVAIKLLAWAMVAGVAYRAIPNLTIEHEKTLILKQLSDYLDEVKKELSQQITVIGQAYVDAFNSLATEVGEK